MPTYLLFPVGEDTAEHTHLQMIKDWIKISEVLFAYNGGEYTIRCTFYARLF
jgi:hypothetical protein